jgi:hypothetical protein
MVDYAWLIPALSLAAFIIIVFGTRVMDVRARRAAEIPAGATEAGHPAGLTHEEAATMLIRCAPRTVGTDLPAQRCTTTARTGTENTGARRPSGQG